MVPITKHGFHSLICKIERQTSPLKGWMFGCQILVKHFTRGGTRGYWSEKVSSNWWQHSFQIPSLGWMVKRMVSLTIGDEDLMVIQLRNLGSKLSKSIATLFEMKDLSSSWRTTRSREGGSKRILYQRFHTIAIVWWLTFPYTSWFVEERTFLFLLSSKLCLNLTLQYWAIRFRVRVDMTCIGMPSFSSLTSQLVVWLDWGCFLHNVVR